MQSEVTITIKGEDSTFKKKFLHHVDEFNNYQTLSISGDCPELRKMIDQALYEFKGDPEDILFKITGRIK